MRGGLADVDGGEWTFGSLAADEREAFASRRSRQPATERVRIPDCCGAFEEAEPGVLYRISGIGGFESVRTARAAAKVYRRLRRYEAVAKAEERIRNQLRAVKRRVLRDYSIPNIRR